MRVIVANVDPWKERVVEAPKRPHDVRSDFERDRSRIVHSASFRRLQAKTQVIGVREGDFHRTRLTHSMEAAQIGRGLVLHLTKSAREKAIRKALPPLELIEVICLAHDLGHPPFGHGGERALNYCMRKTGGFEGNGQTLRILTLLEKHTQGHGVNLTRRSLLGILKYPLAYSDVARFTQSTLVDYRTLGVKHAKPPKCYLDADKGVVDWILQPLNDSDRRLFREIREPDGSEPAHAKPLYKALDTSIMELADDIAYGVHDLEDMISLKLITRQDWEKHVRDNERALAIGKDLRRLADSLFSATSHERKRAIGGFVNRLVTSTRIVEQPGFEHPLLRYTAVLDEPARSFLDVLSELVFETVIDSSEVQTLEYRGQQIVLGLFQAFSSDPERMLPGDSRIWYQQTDTEDARARVICDYIAGMTDDFAERIFERLFLPRSGSVFQRM